MFCSQIVSANFTSLFHSISCWLSLLSKRNTYKCNPYKFSKYNICFYYNTIKSSKNSIFVPQKHSCDVKIFETQNEVFRRRKNEIMKMFFFKNKNATNDHENYEGRCIVTFKKGPLFFSFHFFLNPRCYSFSITKLFSCPNKDLSSFHA